MYLNQAVEYLRKNDARLSKVIDWLGPIDPNYYNQSYDSFVFLVKEIIGQMISASVKKIIFARLIELCNHNITPNVISDIPIDKLRSIGLSKSKSRFIHNLSELVMEGKIDFDYIATLSDEDAKKELIKIEGIGNWTAKMYLLFFLQRDDILPFEDGAFLQAYKWLYDTEDTHPMSIMKICASWKPYSSTGARYLYRALDTGLTKKPISVFLESNEK